MRTNFDRNLGSSIRSHCHSRAFGGLTYKESPELHLTSSGLVFSESGTSIVAIFHEKEEIWIQPGGHWNKAKHLRPRPGEKWKRKRV
jgi:hypothetical protein